MKKTPKIGLLSCLSCGGAPSYSRRTNGAGVRHAIACTYCERLITGATYHAAAAVWNRHLPCQMVDVVTKETQIRFVRTPSTVPEIQTALLYLLTAHPNGIVGSVLNHRFRKYTDAYTAAIANLLACGKIEARPAFRGGIRFFICPPSTPKNKKESRP